MLLVGALLVWGGLTGIRWLAARVVTRFPVSLDKQIGRHAAEGILQRETQCADQRPLGAIVDRFRPHLPTEFRDIHAYLLKDEQVNAFALPGGDLFVLSGLVRQAKSTDEVAGVLGHEVGHAVLRHGMRRIARQASLTIVLALLVGGTDDVASSLVYTASDLGALRFDRDDEREADDFGLDLCARAGIDTRSLAEFLGRLPSSPVAWLSTHPSSDERRERLLQKARMASTTTDRPLPTIDEMRQACGK